MKCNKCSYTQENEFIYCPSCGSKYEVIVNDVKTIEFNSEKDRKLREYLEIDPDIKVDVIWIAKHLNQYQNLILLKIGIPAFIGLYLALHTTIVNDSFYQYCLFVGLILGIITLIAYMNNYKTHTGLKPNIFYYMRYFIISIIAYTGFVVCITIGLNEHLDNSNVNYRKTIIINKESHRVRRAGRSFNISVQSWRSDLDNIKIKVNPSTYTNYDVGEVIVVKTKEGFLGIEYILPQ